ncbi:MAG: hypothetical protein JJU36_08970 [Phycisphaeraceae bacterium]|nr:hypothetical protein [Phycisphaeraceae bacterium]
MADVRRMMEACGIPGADDRRDTASPLRFPDGAHYRHEASGISTLKLLETLMDESTRRGVAVHRVIFGMRGSADRLTMPELREVATLAHARGVELVMETGISAKTDVGSHFRTEQGVLAGIRPRGSDQLSHAIANMLRAAEAGIRGFLLRCEGHLWLADQLRRRGDLPNETVFKMSYDCGHANPAGAKLLEANGADSFNPITDLEVGMLASIRRAITIPMDLVVFGWPSLGGIRRAWSAPAMIRAAAPVYYYNAMSASIDIVSGY